VERARSTHLALVTLVILVALSTADANKWSAVIEGCREPSPASGHAAPDNQRSGPIRQRQRLLTEAQVADMAVRYERGATVYELAAEFGCHRTTVAERLKKLGIRLRGRPSSLREV
jgi:DNA-binding NtrC family response regulator